MGGKRKMIDAEELDRLFDEGEEDILQYFDTDHVRYPGLEARTVAVDLPAWVFEAVERESAETGTPVRVLIERWVAEKVGLGAV